jgi:hypothetical protein
MSGKKPNKEELERLYLEEGKSLKEIKNIYGISYNTLMDLFEEYKITRRNRGEAIKIGQNKNSRFKTEEEWVRYGLDNGYDERNITSLEKSKNDKERSWYSRGYRNKWLGNFSFERKQKSSGYWKDWNNFEAEMRNVIEDNDGEFPSLGKLYEMGKNGLVGAISKYHEGVNVVRKRMGFNSVEVPNWQDGDFFLSEMRQAIEENGGEFPSQSKLKEMGKISLLNSIYKYYDGMGAVKEKMGFVEESEPVMLERLLTGYVGGKI